MVVTTERQLGQALKRDEDSIEIEGDLITKVVRIKATGRVAWAVAVGAIGIAVCLTIATVASGGAATPVAVVGDAVAAPAAVATIGLPATIVAISIAVAGGGVAALTKLRKYRIREKSPDRLLLKR